MFGTAHTSGFSTRTGSPGARPRLAREMAQHLLRGGAALLGGDPGPLTAVQQIPRGEDTGFGRAEGGVDGRSAGARVERDPAASRQFVVGDPVTGEHDRVAAEGGGPPVLVAQPYTGQPAPSEQFDDVRPGQQGDGSAQRRHGGAGLFGDHGDGLGAARAQGAYRGEGDRFRADDDRAAADPLVVQMDGLLEFAGGEDARGPGAGDKPCAARAFTGSGGEDHGPCRDGLQACRSYRLQGARARPAGDGDAGAQPGAGAYGVVDEPAGVLGAAERPLQIAEPEAAVAAVARDAAGLLLAFDDLDPAGSGGGQAGGRGEPGRAGPDDKDVDRAYRHRRSSSNRARTAGPQKNP